MKMIAYRLSNICSPRLVPAPLAYGSVRMVHASRRTLAKSHPSSQAQSTSSLLNMVTNGGGILSQSLSISTGEHGGLGLRAAFDIKPGDRLVFLPESSTLTYDGGVTDRRLVRLIDLVPEELWGVKVALALLAERVKGPESPFHPYISNLPIGFSGVPMFYSRDDIAQLEYPPVVAQVKKRGVFLYEFATKHLTGLSADEDPFGGVQVDTNALGWALAAVSSRAFRTRGPSLPASLLPLIDLANHSFEPSAEVKVEERGGVRGISLVSKREIKKDEEITLSYGPLTNDFLLLDYGFIIPSNPHDRVQLRWSQGLVTTGALIAGLEEKEARLADWQIKLLTMINLEGPSANTEVCFGGSLNGGVDPRLIAGARILLAGAENALQGRDIKSLGNLEEPLGIKTETRTLRALSGVAALTLSNFKTTLREDEEALVRGVIPTVASRDGSSPPPLSQPLTDEARLAIRFRVEKKRILSQIIKVLGSRLEILVSKERKESAGPTSSKGFGAIKKK